MSHKELSSNFLKCLELEKFADIEQTSQLLKSFPPKKLAQRGLAIINLQIDSIKTGLGGRTIVELQNDLSSNNNEFITIGDIRTGDIVKIDKLKPNSSSTKNKKSKSVEDINNNDNNIDNEFAEGVITRISLTSIIITIDESFEEKILNFLNVKIWIVKISNSITYKRMESTLRKLSEFDTIPNDLLQLLISKDFKIPLTTTSNKQSIIKFNNENLNDSQKFAINFSLNSPISIIHGPPGTGKTYTIIEIIQQLVSKGERILVCGPSNISIDTILERLNGKIPNDQLLRIGHPARLLQSNLKHSLDIVSNYSDEGQLINDIKKEIESTIKKIKKTRSYKEKRAIWTNVKELKKELKVREKKITDQLILRAKVIVATLHGSSSRELLNLYNSNPGIKIFDTLIIDEVSQSLEPQCWIPLINHYKSDIKKLILAGDNKQLPPTIKLDKNDKVKAQLETTLFDRLIANYGDSFKNLLNIQYRMNEKIMKFSSKELYNDELKADESVAKILPYDLTNVNKTDNTEFPLIWYDTQGGEFPERDSSDDNDNEIISSKYNEMEGYLVLYHLKQLLQDGLNQSDIGIIAPYNSQISFLKSLILSDYPDLEISTVDGFQGREKEIIILSLVRSNDRGEIGFLKDERRLNVAITRAKRQLCIIGDLELMSRQKSSKFIKDWSQWIEENAEIIYPNIDDIL
ncbi:hypothetical protein WICMUC_001511 [Wickerhamomyces mucosus]|uniref:DNA helicase n=1 Tax=Wickerhamomyces mucosus TaxID=1378264 RepID=A0A9P8PWE4_9ASCO|nr:hypothetical protein WICMUC_001511 [Wickerhamomyces mucosus]